MPSWLKTLLKILGSVLCLVILLWCGLAAYVYSHKEQVLKNITAQLNSNINGRLTIGSMEPALLRGFPGISVSLHDVSLEDSLYHRHGRRLLQAKDIFVAVDIFSLISSTPRIRNIRVTNGSIYMFTDSTGYSNSSIFGRKEDSTADKPSPHINDLSFEKVWFVFENKTKFKYFRLFIHRMAGNVDYDRSGWTARINTRMRIRDFTFNTTKGSFLRNKLLRANLTIHYDREKELVKVPPGQIMLDGNKLVLGASFLLAVQPVQFSLQVSTRGISFSDASSLLSPGISAKLSAIDLQDPLDLRASINGRIKFRDTPLVFVQWTVTDNTLFTPVGTITGCRFRGNFTNEYVRGKGHNDPNSAIRLYGFKGIWEEIPFRVDSLRISNLRNPVLEGRFYSDFPLTRLNPVIGGRSLAFTDGTAHLDLLYKGGIKKEDTTKAYVYGSIRAVNTAMTYLPRELRFTNSSATVTFRGRDLFISDVRLAQGHSVLRMNGSILNFLSLYYTDPGKMLLDWNIRSEQIDLDDFTSFLGQRKAGAPPPVRKDEHKPGNAISRISEQMDKVLEASSVRMKLSVGKLAYRSFTANDIDAAVFMGPEAIVLDHIVIGHAGGRLSVSGSIDQRAAVNNFRLKADIDDVDVQRFFTSFQNFGQDAITDEHIRGNLFAKAEISGSIRDNGKIVPYSLNGTVRFDLKNGALVDFSPMQKIGKVVFRNRDFSNISVSRLENTLGIKGDKVIINPMFIESSVLNVQIEGVYAFNKGTDINIDVPLRNPEKDRLVLNDSIRMERGMKGIVVHLKAVDGDDGNVKIRLIRRNEHERKRKNKGK